MARVKKQIEEFRTEVVFKYKDFTNDDGEVVGYLSAEIEIDDEPIRLAVKSEDKKLLQHLLKAEGLINPRKNVGPEAVDQAVAKVTSKKGESEEEDAEEEDDEQSDMPF